MLRVSIRYKLLLVILTLLLIPWMGYQYVREMKSFALQGQEEALLLTAGAIATVLHDRPELFSAKTTSPEADSNIGDLQVMSLDHPLTMDGKLDDWGRLAENAGHYSAPRLLKKPAGKESDLSFNHVLGSWGATFTRYLSSRMTSSHCVIPVFDGWTTAIIYGFTCVMPTTQ